MKESFNTSAGRVEVLVDEQSRTVSAYRFDAEGRPAAAAIESWDYTDLADLLIRQTGVPAWEANEIASGVKARLAVGDAPPEADAPRWGERRRRERKGSMENAGIPLRFVAVLGAAAYPGERHECTNIRTATRDFRRFRGDVEWFSLQAYCRCHALNVTRQGRRGYPPVMGGKNAISLASLIAASGRTC
jgi:hypothetical protein